ncbi:MAG: hypothetical protein JSU90_01185 [Nitrospiraceae bacterium]|nr:MAG: hypothetical protein JSU90_01185 [Nitrospiraceae bacterium]
MHETLRKFDPAVDKRILIALSGFIWFSVGILLCRLAIGWLSRSVPDTGPWLGISGAVLAFLIHHYGFLKLVNRNIDRIRTKKGKVCIFGFQPWKSYVIIIIMIALGRTLRYSALPKSYLAVIYIGFGGAMFLSSFYYFRALFILNRDAP